MNRLLRSLAQRLWPELLAMRGLDFHWGWSDLLGVLIGAPLAGLGLLWLILRSDPAAALSTWPELLLFLLLLYPARRLTFFVVGEVETGSYSDYGDSLEEIVLWSAMLVAGPNAIWLGLLWSAVSLAAGWRAIPTVALRWNRLRNAVLQGVEMTLINLFALSVYERLGGRFPLAGLDWAALLPAFAAILTAFLLSRFLWMLYLAAAMQRTAHVTGSQSYTRRSLRFMLLTTTLPGLLNPFAILAAGLYTAFGLGIFLFFMATLLLVGLLAHRLSVAAETNRQRSRELEKLELLGRALIASPPDASTLPAILQEHIPGMFSDSRVEIHLYEGGTLLHHPADWPPVPAAAWAWLHSQSEAQHIPAGQRVPWTQASTSASLILAPVANPDAPSPQGGVYLEMRRLHYHYPGGGPALLPAIQTLAAQLSSVLHAARVYAQTLALQKTEQELALAGRIQAGFLPDSLPEVAGWQLAARLEPARQTSGDFYDVLWLPDGALAIIIADVADKGLGAALYMALSRTLLRTYTAAYPDAPAAVCRAANSRMLSDTRADLFVTLVLAVLDPVTGRLIYCNAGHNPPLLLRSREPAAYKLERTGVPLGLFEDTDWQQRTVHLGPGDRLLLYTDGVTEAENGQGEFFGEDRLLAVASGTAGATAAQLGNTLQSAVRAFIADAPQADDITWIAIQRVGRQSADESRKATETPKHVF